MKTHIQTITLEMTTYISHICDWCDNGQVYITQITMTFVVSNKIKFNYVMFYTLLCLRGLVRMSFVQC